MSLRRRHRDDEDRLITGDDAFVQPVELAEVSSLGPESRRSQHVRVGPVVGAGTSTDDSTSDTSSTAAWRSWPSPAMSALDVRRPLSPFEAKAFGASSLRTPREAGHGSAGDRP